MDELMIRPGVYMSKRILNRAKYSLQRDKMTAVKTMFALPDLAVGS